MRRTLVILTIQTFVIVAVILLSITAGGSTLAQDAGDSTFARLDGVTIYFTEASREATPFDRSPVGLSRFAGLLSAVGATVKTLDWRLDVPADADLVVIAGPTRDIEDYMTARLWAYLNQGGSLLVMIDPILYTNQDGVTVTEMNDRALRRDRGLFLLTWSGYGLRARDDVVVTEIDDGRLDRDLTTSEVNGDHPILEGIAGPVAIFSARSVEVDSSIQAYNAQPLIYSGPEYYGETLYVDYLQLNAEDFTPGADTARGRLPLAAASESRTTGARIVVIGDGGIASNGEGFLSAPSNTAGFVFPENVRFMMNTVAWLVNADTEQTETFAFPTPGATATPTPEFIPTATPEPAEEAESADEASG